jgi:hypothetical protein
MLSALYFTRASRERRAGFAGRVVSGGAGMGAAAGVAAALAGAAGAAAVAEVAVGAGDADSVTAAGAAGVAVAGSDAAGDRAATDLTEPVRASDPEEKAERKAAAPSATGRARSGCERLKRLSLRAPPPNRCISGESSC